jgi:murein L,D-transpeptidase YcbB/YkuD
MDKLDQCEGDLMQRSTSGSRTALLRKGRLSLIPFALLAGVALPLAAHAQAPVEQVQAALAREGGMDRGVRDFYAARDFRPLWLAEGAGFEAAERVVEVLETARLDGLDPGAYRTRRLRGALDDAQDGEAKHIARADAMLSRSFAAYVRDLRRPDRLLLEFTDPELRPVAPDAGAVLAEAAGAPSLVRYLDDTQWMHPLYAKLRAALAAAPEGSSEARLLRLNLERARALPGAGQGRHIVVDAAGTRLYMYDHGRVVDSMKVIVGRPVTPTPMMASTVRYATLNPYWNVPTDLVRERIAPQVLAKGPAYLKAQGYDVLSDWSVHAAPTNPGLVDWNAVASGAREVRVRQRPGVSNGMGRMKFMFPNGHDIYLHDTPGKGLFSSGERYFSAGCIRLEDAARLGRWLFGRPLKAVSPKPELKVELPEPVPIYITYLTVFPEGQRIAMRPDSYGRDGAAVSGEERQRGR